MNASEITNYYNKTEVDSNLLLKADKLTTYTKTEVDSNLLLKSDKLTTYTKTEVDSNLLLKSDKLTTYTKTEIDTLFNNLIDAAPTVLNTLNELAVALNDDANYATTVQNQIALKQNKIENVSDTEIGYLNGVTQPIQQQFNARQKKCVYTSRY